MPSVPIFKMTSCRTDIEFILIIITIIINIIIIIITIIIIIIISRTRNLL